MEKHFGFGSKKTSQHCKENVIDKENCDLKYKHNDVGKDIDLTLAAIASKH